MELNISWRTFSFSRHESHMTDRETPARNDTGSLLLLTLYARKKIVTHRIHHMRSMTLDYMNLREQDRQGRILHAFSSELIFLQRRNTRCQH